MQHMFSLVHNEIEVSVECNFLRPLHSWHSLQTCIIICIAILGSGPGNIQEQCALKSGSL